MVTFQPSSDDGSPQTLCGIVPIINDMIGNEPDEEFSVRLISASPDGDFGDSESCITIIDDDGGLVHAPHTHTHTKECVHVRLKWA